MLSDASPYWRARLESQGFNEKRIVVADSAHHGDDEDEDEQDEGMVDSDDDVSDSSFSDSDSDSDSSRDDDDDDDQKREEQPRIENNETATMTGTSTRHRGGRHGGGEMPVRVVAIEDGTSFRTYRALVAFLYTGEIEFTPVRSKFASRSERRSHLALSRARATQSPSSSSSSCCQCSPKSLFALAHFLSLDDHNDDSSNSDDACAPAPLGRRRRRTVSSVALEAYRSQLTLENALDELLSPFCETYEAAREVVVGWILEDDDQDDLDLDRSGTTGRARTKTNKTRWDKLRKRDEVRRWKERVEKGGISIGELDLLFKLSGISG